MGLTNYYLGVYFLAYVATKHMEASSSNTLYKSLVFSVVSMMKC
jgi:hypothetical protein